MKVFKDLEHNYPILKVCIEEVYSAFHILRDAVASGGRIFLCGNGGSASDAEHITGELLKSFLLPRSLDGKRLKEIEKIYPDDSDFFAKHLQQGIPAISLVSGDAINTAIANDTHADFIFAQKLYVLGCENDVLWCLSTSGNSLNVINAAKVAKIKGLKVVAMTGNAGGEIVKHADIVIKVPFKEVYRIQEHHLPIYHALCLGLEEAFFGEERVDINCIVNRVRIDNKKRQSKFKSLMPEKIEMVVFDFDGVFTDNKVLTLQDGREAVVCDRSDGLGIQLLKQAAIPMLILSTEENPVVRARASKLKLNVEFGCKNKEKFLTEFCIKNNIDLQHVIYMGNDVNDLNAMKLVGFSVAPYDAHPKIKKIANRVLYQKGGDGAVREFCDIVLNKQE